MLQREQIDYLLVNAYNAAIRAGARILDIYNSDDFNINLKSDNTPITLADREAHTLIKNYLSQTRIPLLSEEGRNLLFEERCNWDLFWLIDPLDGTKEFIKRDNHEFTVNIALMVDNEPFMGVVYAPCFDTMYFSDMERGAFMKEHVVPDKNAEFSINEIYTGAKQLPLTSDKNNPIRITISRSHLSPETDRFVEKMKEHFGGAEVISKGSSLKFCLVAEGTADFYVRTTNTFEWDTAAGHAIAAAAGAIAVDLAQQESLKYNKEDLANPFFFCKSKHITT